MMRREIAFRFARRSPDERRLLVKAAALQLAVRAALPLVGVRRIVDLAMRTGRVRGGSVDRRSLAWALQATAGPVGGSCLTQAVAALVLAGGAAAPIRFVLAVRAGDGTPDFHAWADLAGMPIPSTTLPAGYTPLLIWR